MDPEVRPEFTDIRRFPNPEGRRDKLRLDKNENLNMVSQAFVDRFAERLSPAYVSVYPEFGPLKAKLGGYVGVDPEQLILCAGSDSGIKQIFDVFAAADTEVVFLKPTYAMYPVYTDMSGASAVPVGYGSDFKLNPSALGNAINDKTRIIAVANPNSPTGTIMSVDELTVLLRRAQDVGAVLIVDEAYHYFTDVTMLPLVATEDNLVVTRSFSKAFGLAGCRAGYLAASHNLVEKINRARPLYEMSGLSALAVETALDMDDMVSAYAAAVKEGAAYLRAALSPLGAHCFDTHTNFMNIRMPDHVDSADVEAAGLERGILFKGRLGSGAFKNCVRVTLGGQQTMTPFVALLEELLS